jgi:hypothetical protein
MTRTKAFADAKKRVKTVRKIDGETRRLSQDEWLADVNVETEKTMASTRVVQLSEKYDAPTFAEDYLVLCQRLEQHRDLSIRSQSRIEDKSKKTGYRLVWDAV